MFHLFIYSWDFAACPVFNRFTILSFCLSLKQGFAMSVPMTTSLLPYSTCFSSFPLICSSIHPWLQEKLRMKESYPPPTSALPQGHADIYLSRGCLAPAVIETNFKQFCCCCYCCDREQLEHQMLGSFCCSPGEGGGFPFVLLYVWGSFTIFQGRLLYRRDKWSNGEAGSILIKDARCLIFSSAAEH